MKTIENLKKKRLIKEANELLDNIEATLHFIVDSIKEKKSKKAA